MFSAQVKVRFYETDMMEVVHHTNHIRWFELARVAFFKQIGLSLWDLMNENILFPIKQVSCTYHEPARFDDELRIEAYLVKMSRAQMVFEYRIVREADGALIATGSSQNVFTDKQSGKVIRLSDTFFKPLYEASEGKK